jgi:hypothetical protein
VLLRSTQVPTTAQPELSRQIAVPVSLDRVGAETSPSQPSADQRRAATSQAIPAISIAATHSKHSLPSNAISDETAQPAEPKDIAAITEIFSQDDTSFDPLADLYGLP